MLGKESHPKPPRLSNIKSEQQIAFRPSSINPLSAISPGTVPNLPAARWTSTSSEPAAKGIKRKSGESTLQAWHSEKRPKTSVPECDTIKRQVVLQDAQTGTESTASLVPPQSVAEAAAAGHGVFTEDEIFKLLPGSLHGHAADIFKRDFWSMDLERDLRLRWTDADEALRTSCPTVSAGELYVWRAMPRLFGCTLPDLFRYGLSTSFYPEVVPGTTSNGTNGQVPEFFSVVSSAFFPRAVRGARHEPNFEAYFKALARLLPHPIFRGDVTRLRFVLQQAVRARVGPAHHLPFNPPYSKTPNNFVDFARTCCYGPRNSRPSTREERDRELGEVTLWMSYVYIVAHKEMTDIVETLTDMHASHHSQSPDKTPKVDDAQEPDSINVLFDLQLQDLNAVYSALERMSQVVLCDPESTSHPDRSVQVYAAPARYFVDDLKATPEITDGGSGKVFAGWVMDQKRAWIFSRRREAQIRQRMRTLSSCDENDRPYLLDIPPFDPDGVYYAWPGGGFAEWSRWL